jgi:hypothetical protein
MAMERSTVVGVFSDRASADNAVAELHRMNFRDDQIGFIMRGDHGNPVTGKGGEVHDDRAAENAATGMAVGAGVGGAIAAAAALAIPGIGPVLAGGILTTIIGGAAAGAAAGGLIGMLTGMGVPDEEARYYESEFNQGKILVTVKADGRYMEAREALLRAGAYDIENRRAA